INLEFFSDMSAVTGAMLSGEIDVATMVRYNLNTGLFRSDDIQIVAANGSLGQIIHMRADKEPFDDKLVRQAMALALNREEIAAGLFGPEGEAAPDTPWTDLFPETIKVDIPSSDPEGAKALLAQA